MDIEELVSELESRLSTNSGIEHITLIESSSTIGKIASVILGILSMLVVILVPIMIAVEIVYICFPVIREKTDQVMVKLETKGADKKLLGVAFRDAKHAIQQVYCSGNLTGTTGDILLEYGKIKIKSVVFVFFILALVLQGGAYIVDVVWSIVGNLIESIFY